MKQMDDKFKKKCTSKEGSYLKKRRSIGGLGAGIIAGSAVILFAALMLMFMLIATGDEDLSFMGLVVGGGAGAISLAFILLGVSMSKKRSAGYMEYFTKRTGYTREELESLDREAGQPDTVYGTEDGKLRSNSALACELVTKNWLVMSFKNPVRLADVAAVFYEQEAFDAGQKWNRTLFVLLSHGELFHQQCKESYAMDLIGEIKKRNPGTIGSRCFKWEGNVIDCLKEPKKAAQLYCEAMGAR